jgi:Domain of unknown function DUF1828
MTSLDLERSFKGLVSGQIDITPDGKNKFIIHAPFRFDDGDHFVIVLKNLGDGWFLTDEGHTFMHLSYSGFTINESRANLISQVVSAAFMEESRGELILHVAQDDFGSALFSFLQALTRIVEVSKWTREQVPATFSDDFKDLMSSIVPENRIEFDYSDPIHDPHARYKVDCRVNHMPTPLYVFAVANDLKCKDATITIHQLRGWKIKFDSMVIFDDQSSISRPTLARFSDVVGKQFSSIRSKSEIEEYLRQHVPGLDV